MKKLIEDCKYEIQSLQEKQEELYNNLVDRIELIIKLKLTDEQKNVIFDYVFNDFESPIMKEFLK